MHHHQPERLRDPGLSLQPQALHHRAPSGEECQEAHHEHSQEAPGPATGSLRYIVVLICPRSVKVCLKRVTGVAFYFP